MYKRQGRSQCEMLTHAYGGFLVQVDVTVFYSRQDATFGITFILVMLEDVPGRRRQVNVDPAATTSAYLLVTPL